MKNVAVYWDFENIHASLCARANGPTWYRENLFTKQPHVVDINSIMQYIAELGNININRAYANWSFLHTYSADLQSFSIDLIQLFPRGRHGKNGADIRMSIEILEDLTINKHIDTIVLIGGDSDYIAVAQKVRQRGKSIIGIGVQETTNQYWVKSCNEFKYYSSLLVKSSRIENLEAEGYELEDLDSAKALLKKAIDAGISGTTQDFVLKAALKPLMQRFDPSFDESNYGFRSFADFLSACGDVVKIEQGEHDHQVTLIGAHTDHASNGRPAASNEYEMILKKQQIRLLQPKVMSVALEEAFRLLDGHEINTVDFKDELAKRLSERLPDFSTPDASKVRSVMYKAMAFRYLEDNKTTLAPGIESADDLIYKVRLLLVKRILDNTGDEAPDAPLLAEMLYGDEGYVDEVYMLLADYNQGEQGS